MNTNAAVIRLRDVIRRKHLAWSTEQTYCNWLRRYCSYLKRCPVELSSEQKIERFLTRVARSGVSASTQNQAFNSLLFFYKECLGAELKNIQALSAKTPVHTRTAPTREDTLTLIRTIQSDAPFAISLAVRLLYGCGLRVTEPLNLREQLTSQPSRPSRDLPFTS